MPHDGGVARHERSAPAPNLFPFHPRLEALRGVAALTVAAFHTWQSTWIDGAGQRQSFLNMPSAGEGVSLTSLVLQAVGNGFGAVVLFFVLSGFVLTASLMRGPQVLGAGTFRFVTARLFRIYPAVFATILIFAMLFWITGASLAPPEAYAPASLLKNLLLIDISIDGVMWSLQLELIAIPIILVGYQAWRHWGIWALLAIFGTLAVLSFSGPWNRALGAPYLFGEIHAFVLGMIAFVIGPQLIGRCSRRAANVIFAAAWASLLVARPLLGVTSHWTQLAEAVGAAVIIAMLASDKLGSLAAIFDLGLTRFFGRISYSFYLLHPLTLIVMWKNPGVLATIIAAGVPPTLLAIVMFLGSTALVAPLAWIVYRWVERTGVAMGRRLTASPRLAASPVPGAS